MSCTCFWTNAQEVKEEREQRVKEKVVPGAIREWLSDTYPKAKKVKWYFETNSGKDSYEAKFKFGGERHSVEFSTEGIVEDIEIDKSLKELSPEVQDALKGAFGKFKKFKLEKIQEQWSADTPDQLKSAILNQDPAQATILYEVEFRAEIEGKLEYWEGLFNPEGKLLLRRKRVLRPTDNLDF